MKTRTLITSAYMIPVVVLLVLASVFSKLVQSALSKMTSSTSCGALFKGTTQTISVKSFQEGSTIEVDGQTYVSPALIELPRNQNYIVTISKEGYETEKIKINRTVSGGIVVLDILAGLVPVIIDAAMGTWYNLSPEEINVNLKSKHSGSLDIPVKITSTSDASLKIESPQPVQIKVEKAE